MSNLPMILKPFPGTTTDRLSRNYDIIFVNSLKAFNLNVLGVRSGYATNKLLPLILKPIPETMTQQSFNSSVYYVIYETQKKLVTLLSWGQGYATGRCFFF